MNQRPIMMRSSGPIIRQVSQVSFAVGGEAPFEQTVRETVIWMRKRNRAIPEVAIAGGAFDVGGGGDSPARAVALEFENGRLWAASLDDPDKNVAGRTWVTEVTVAEQAGRVLFGTRLINVTRGIDAPYVPSLPGLSRQIISQLPATADQISLSDVAQRVTNPEDVDDLIALLDDPSRKLPVVAIADGATREQFAVPAMIAGRLAGASHVVSLDTEATWELTRRIGKALSVFDGAARAYRPGFASDRADPFEHPLWIPRDGTTLDGRTDLVVARLLSDGVSTGRSDDYPRFNVIRQAVAAREIQVRRSDASDSDLSHLFEEENQRLTEDLKSIRAEFDQWLEDAEVFRKEAERGIAELKSQLARARAQIDTLRAAMAGGSPTAERVPLEDYYDFEEWASNNLSTCVWIAPKAVKEVEKNGQFENPRLLGDALVMLDELYVPMRRNPSPERRSQYEKRLQDLNCLDQPCFSEKGTIKGFPSYSVTYLGDKYWCDSHIKYGGGTDPKRFFRIYYHWHEDDQVLLIGHLPTHLDNKLTN
jgi:hypothetical protein